jgi:heat shock transcription factor, other eukaryote
MTCVSESPLASFAFPRTGKRGVPQQFPRRLYEMLDSETKFIEASSSHPKVISWSESGRSFRIFDVSEFAESVLPKYFRTKKFSSFQRNLNLVSIFGGLVRVL